MSEGACSLRDLVRELGVGSGCGKCVPHAQQYLQQLLATRAAATPAAPEVVELRREA